MEMDIVMTKQTIYTATLMAVIAVIHMLRNHFALSVNVLLEELEEKYIIHFFGMATVTMKPIKLNSIMMVGTVVYLT